MVLAQRSRRRHQQNSDANSSSAQLAPASFLVWKKRATWEDAKEALLTRLGIGSITDEAWAALKNLNKGSKDIVELAGEAGKLAKRLHPRDEEASECHAVDAFLGALDRTLAAEVQKLGHKTMEDAVAASRRIEKILDEHTDTKMERLVSTMQEQIRLLRGEVWFMEIVFVGECEVFVCL